MKKVLKWFVVWPIATIAVVALVTQSYDVAAGFARAGIGVVSGATGIFVGTAPSGAAYFDAGRGAADDALERARNSGGEVAPEVPTPAPAP